MKEFFGGMVDKPHIVKRIIFCFFAVCMMGFTLSWLSLLAWGTDPCSVMNMAIAKKLGILFGTWQLLLNVFLFLIVIWKDKKQIGFGTVFNMVLVGYSCDFMTFIRTRLWPDLTLPKVHFTTDKFVVGDFFLDLGVMIVALGLFVFSVAVYMSVELGTAPYDAVPFIIADGQKRLSFRIVRMIWDISVAVIGFFAGGVIGIVTVVMAFTIGPMAAWVGKKIRRFIE